MPNRAFGTSEGQNTDPNLRTINVFVDSTKGQIQGISQTTTYCLKNNTSWTYVTGHKSPKHRWHSIMCSELFLIVIKDNQTPST